jgi:hypothetical protein
MQTPNDDDFSLTPALSYGFSHQGKINGVLCGDVIIQKKIGKPLNTTRALWRNAGRAASVAWRLIRLSDTPGHARFDV